MKEKKKENEQCESDFRIRALFRKAKGRGFFSPVGSSSDYSFILQVACAYKKNRFYLFTNAEPFSVDESDNADGTGMGRDVFNEKPTKEDIITAVEV